MTIDLNVDLGEGSPHDAVLMSVASSVNIACGGHAGDMASMDQAIAMALGQGLSLGAHPSFPDRAHFGRRHHADPPPGLADILSEQVEAFNARCQATGASLHHIKPHGALYNQAHQDERFAAAIVEAHPSREVFLYGLPGGELEKAARQAGIPFAGEGFIDRGYQADGSLVARGQEGAVISDPDQAARQALALCHAGTVRTLCVHSDSEDALELLEFVRKRLAREGIAIAPFS
ncbi:MAG: LamB/YcsF family protein [Verrucomicrobiota bacterium JB023]|nr:LamB/YcsF family protein [Verrucomicrobiota bacterium JB023]